MAAMTAAPDPPAGWALLADRTTPGPARSIERYGVVYRHPLPPGTDVAMAPGQPCILLSLDRARVVGLWAIGEVVAEPLHLPAGFAWTAAEAPMRPDEDGDDAGPPPARCWAEVELLPLEKPVPLEQLAAHRDLSGSALVDPARHPPVPGPMPLGRAELRAIESFDTWLVPPDPDRRAELDQLLDDEERTLP